MLRSSCEAVRHNDHGSTGKETHRLKKRPGERRVRMSALLPLYP